MDSKKVNDVSIVRSSKMMFDKGFEPFVKFGIDLKFTKTKNGFKKEKVFLPNDWQKMTKSTYTDSQNFAVLTGPVNNLVLIDFDVNSEEDGIGWFSFMFGLITDLFGLVTKTPSGGIHAYCTYNPIFASNLTKLSVDGLKYPIDIKTTGGMAYQGLHYEILKNEQIKECPEKFLRFIEKYYSDKLSPISQKSLNDFEMSVEVQKDRVPVTSKKLNDTIDKLNDKNLHNSDYTQWLDICFGIYNTAFENDLKDPYEYVHRFSKRSSSYDEKAMKTINSIKYRENGIKFGTLVSIVKKAELEDKSVQYESISQAGTVEGDTIYSKTEGETKERPTVRILFKEYPTKIKYCKDNLWIKLFSNQWSSDEKLIKRQINSWISTECPEVSVSLYNNIFTLFQANAYHFNDDMFEQKFYDSTEGKLCFKNGVLFIETKQFFKWTDKETEEIYTNCMIGYDYVKIDSEVEELYKRVLDPIFDDNIHLRNEFLRVTARALACDYKDKYWTLATGERNSGKGLITHIFQTVFGPYVSTFEPGNLVLNFHTQDDVEKSNGWKIPFAEKRLLFANEIKMAKNSKLDGTVIKSIASGGDTFTARYLHQNSMLYKCRAHMIMFNNDNPLIEPTDAYNNMLFFNFPCVFDSKENSFAKVRKPDTSIKKWVENRDVMLSFITILLNHYGPTEYPLLLEKSQKYVSVSDKSSQDDQIREMFVFTSLETDFISSKEITDKLKQMEITISAQKLCGRLEAFGATHCQKKNTRKTSKGLSRCFMDTRG